MHEYGFFIKVHRLGERGREREREGEGERGGEERGEEEEEEKIELFTIAGKEFVLE